jgi:hypothetical protein
MKRFSSGPRSQTPTPRRRQRHGHTHLVALAITLLLGLAILAPAAQASEGQPESLAAQVQKASSQAIRAAERANRAAIRAAQKAAGRERRTAERLARREAKRKTREAVRLALKEKDGNSVTINCEEVKAIYQGFAAVPGKPNEVSESITIKNPPESISKEPILLTPSTGRKFVFEGADGTDVVPIAFPVGHYLIDVHSKWDTNGHKGSYDIHGNVTCSPRPAYAIQKLQSIAGSGQAPTAETLTGKVGEVVDYQVTVTDTGNTPLTFSEFKDSRCDPGTIVGGSPTPIEPSQTLVFSCTHTLTTDDEKAGFYMNVATVRATPEQDEGGTITHESNAVVVTPVAPEKAKEEPKEKPKEKPEEKPPPKTEETKPKSEVLGTTSSSGGAATTTGTGGVLGFTSATVPSLKGPQGCVRSGFVASIRATGVSSVIFYLDGHRLGRLTFKNAHKGMLSIRINPAKLKVGAHHLLARITMKQSSPAAKAARAARQLTVIRCKSASLTPRFTG